jgi:DNA-directed RNA polymerase subunit RPC12/RpoP
MLPTHDVPCPHCGKALFSSTSLDDAVNAAVPESPRVESDERGYFVRCPFCSNRIAMERVRAEKGAAYRLSR